MRMTSFLFTRGRFLDPARDQLEDGIDVLVEGDRIKEVGPGLVSETATRIDLAGKTLMPGLIDSHVHVIASLVNIAENSALPSSLAALRAAHIMKAMLMRGFTTVRDLGGCDLGLKLAVEEGLIDALIARGPVWRDPDTGQRAAPASTREGGG